MLPKRSTGRKKKAAVLADHHRAKNYNKRRSRKKLHVLRNSLVPLAAITENRQQTAEVKLLNPIYNFIYANRWSFIPTFLLNEHAVRLIIKIQY